MACKRVGCVLSDCDLNPTTSTAQNEALTAMWVPHSVDTGCNFGAVSTPFNAPDLLIPPGIAILQ